MMLIVSTHEPEVMIMALCIDEVMFDTPEWGTRQHLHLC